MGQTTNIEWCDSTLNLLVGCDGCELSGGHCYAEQLVNRHAGRAGWPEGFEHPQTFLERLTPALEWPDLRGKDRPGKPWLDQRPRMIFLNDLSDTFTESIDLRVWDEPFYRMSQSPHIWLVLTKRPKRLAEFVHRYELYSAWPTNIWCGVTVTSQATDHRIADLCRIDGLGVRFLSLEPLLGLIDLTCCEAPVECQKSPNGGLSFDALRENDDRYYEADNHVAWVIAGGESGNGARPMHPDWVRAIRDQCQSARVPFFFKQWGEWMPVDQPWKQDDPQPRATNEQWLNAAGGCGFHGDDVWRMRRVGKKQAGRLLDGREWTEMPRNPT